MKKIIYFLFFVISFNKAFANINITQFDQHIKFTDYGREVTVKIKGEVDLDSRSYFYKQWSYIFDKRLKIQVSEATVPGKKYQTSFGNNELKFQFDRAFNGDQIEFNFKYLEFNDSSEVSYTRQEHVGLPEFAKKASGNLVIEVKNDLQVYSLNPKFKQNSNIYTWSGIIPENGFNDYFYLTLKQAIWKVELLTEIKGDEKISKIDVKIPLYFKNGNNSIEKYLIDTNTDSESTKIKEEGEDIDINFENIDTKNIKVTVNATLKNDFDTKIWVMLDPNKFLDIDNITGRELTNIFFQIRQENKTDEQMYITLAKWVHNYIIYDLSYFGKEMTTLEILNERKGVCSHYAKLYNDLLRTAGIPAILISGVSYDMEKGDFENHAWNLVYANGEWVSIDPTWGLYSGKVPVSHIFFYYNDGPVVNYTIYNSTSNNFTSDIKKNIKFIK